MANLNNLKPKPTKNYRITIDSIDCLGERIGMKTIRLKAAPKGAPLKYRVI
jgi:hypothetical protein